MKHIQFGAYSNLSMPHVEHMAELTANNYGEPMPWQVPEGYVFRITDVHFGSKHVVLDGGPERSSYMHVLAGPQVGTATMSIMFTVNELGPNINFKRYFEVPKNWWVQIDFCNNSEETQNMNGLLIGYLAKP